MATQQLVWDEVGARLFETGVSKVALFPVSTSGTYPEGVAWSGVTAVNESPSGAEANPFYADNIKYLELRSAEEFGCTIEAYYYPDEFAECDGSAELTAGVRIGQQNRKSFGLAYQSLIGNDTEGTSKGYKIHLVYGCTAAPSEKSRPTVNESTEPTTMSWEVTTVPVSVTGFKPTAHVEIDSTKVDATKLKAFEQILYGSTTAAARLPLPDEVATLLGTAQG